MDPLKPTKTAFIILMCATVALAALTAFSYAMTLVLPSDRPETFYQDGIWITPSMEDLERWHKQDEALEPYRLFLAYTWVGVAALAVAWTVWGVAKFKTSANIKTTQH